MFQICFEFDVCWYFISALAFRIRSVITVIVVSGAIEECEHCLAIDDGPPSAPEPIFIDQHILENCHKDFVDSYKQYCNSAAQHGVPAVCVLRAPPHVTSHIIYSCFNENNIQKRLVSRNWSFLKPY